MRQNAFCDGFRSVRGRSCKSIRDIWRIKRELGCVYTLRDDHLSVDFEKKAISEYCLNGNKIKKNVPIGVRKKEKRESILYRSQNRLKSVIKYCFCFLK